MSVILDTIVNFLARASDRVFTGRNRTRIVLGTDRKDTATSGFGEGGEDNVESGTIDIVAGYVPDSGDPQYIQDKSRIYISGKTKPDEYFEFGETDKAEGEPAVVIISDNVYLKARKRIKIINDKFSILVKENGDVTIKSNGKIVFDSNDIKIGDADANETPAWASKLLQELTKIQISLDTGVAGGSTVTFATPYKAPTSVSSLGATKTKIS